MQEKLLIAEVERTFKMLDGAVLILSAKEGIQAQTKLLFSTLQKLQIPTIIFINKIDRAGVNLERLYMDIKTNLSQDVLFMQTVVDGSVYPVCSQTYIKEEYKEFVCNHDDDILERYLAEYDNRSCGKSQSLSGATWISNVQYRYQ